MDTGAPPPSPGYWLAGRVTDTKNMPLGGVEITAKGLKAVSNQDGTYHLGGLPERTGHVFVKAFLEGYSTQSRNERFGPGNSPGISGIDFVLGPEAVISGRVVDTLGLPQAGERIQLQHVADVDRAGAGVGRVLTGPDGRFRIDSVGEGVYSFLLIANLVWQGREHVRAVRPSLNDFLRVHEGDHITGLEVVVPAYADTGVCGYVYDSSRVPQEGLVVEGKGNEGGLCFAVTDTDGWFQVGGLMGQFAELKIGNKVRFAGVPLGGEPLEIVLPGTGRIIGRIVLVNGGALISRPVLDVTRVCLADDPTAELGYSRTPLVWSETTPGQFELSGVPEGIATLVAGASGSAPVVLDVQVNAGAVTQLGDIVLPEACVLEGAVTRDGIPMPEKSMRIWVVWEDRQVYCGVDENGRFVRTDLPAGTHQITATWRDGNGHRQIRNATVELTPGETTSVLFDFGGAATVEGTISARNEFSTLLVYLGDRFDRSLRFEDRQAVDSFIRRHAVASCALSSMTGGDFNFGSIPPGSYHLVALGLRDAHYGGREWVFQEQAVSVSAGEIRVLEMVLE